MSYPPPDLHRLAIFGGIEVKRWDPEPLPPKGQDAFNRFLALTPDALIPVASHVFAYYTDMVEHLGGKGWPGVPLPEIADADEVWAYVTPVSIFVQSDWDDDGPWYVGVEANVPWEVEHGLVLCWEAGERIAKVGQVDGHVTNANSYADPDLQDVVYQGMNPANTTYRRA